MEHLRQQIRNLVSRCRASWRRRPSCSLSRDDKGISIVEVIVAVALLGIIGVGFLSALFTVSRVTLTTDERQTASNLAETQMEYVKSLGYATAYEPAPTGTEYTGYTVNINTAPLQDSNIQKITININHDSKLASTLEGYKVR